MIRTGPGRKTAMIVYAEREDDGTEVAHKGQPQCSAYPPTPLGQQACVNQCVDASPSCCPPPGAWKTMVSPCTGG